MSILDKASLIQIPSGYKEDKLYSVKPRNGEGDFTFTRASTGTRVNSDGYIEEVPWNLINYSEDFSQSSWSKVGTSVIGGFPSPNAPTNAYKLVEDTSSGAHYLAFVNISVKSGGYYTSSAFFKKGESNFIQLLFSSSSHAGGNHANFDLQNGVVGSVSDGVAEIESIGEYYRCSYTSQATASTTTNVFFWKVQSATSSRAESYSGDGTSGVYVWGAQAVKGNAPKPYIKTTDRLDIPRLDYTNSTTPTLLLEPQRTNLALGSENLSLTYWHTSAGSSMVNDTTISPDGTQNASTLTFGSSQGSQYEDYFAGSYGNQTHTVSCYVKVASGTAKFRFKCTHWGVADFYSDDYTATDEWQRFTFSKTFTASGGTGIIAGLKNETAGGSKDILVYGFQLETNTTYPTSYIPTSGTSVTRVKDTCELTNNATLPTDYPFALYFEADNNENSGHFISFLDNTQNNKYALIYTNGGQRFIAVNRLQGTQQFCYGYNVDYGVHKVAAYFENETTIKLFVDGTRQTTATIPSTAFNTSVNDLYLGQQRTIDTKRTSVKSAYIFNEALTDTELETLTTPIATSFEALAEYYGYELL